MSRDDDKHGRQRKRRTHEHVIADLSENYLERLVLLRGHVLRRPARDYGVDVIMFHFDDEGAIENGEVRFQLKATDTLNVIQNGAMISIPIKTGDLHYWALEVYPFILVVFDADVEELYWLDIQSYVEQHPNSVNPDRKSVKVHIPASNTISAETIDAFRQQSLQIAEELRSKRGFSNAPQKPK